MMDSEYNLLKLVKIVDFVKYNESWGVEELVIIWECLFYGIEGLDFLRYDVIGVEFCWNLNCLISG